MLEAAVLAVEVVEVEAAVLAVEVVEVLAVAERRVCVHKLGAVVDMHVAVG